MSVKVQKYPFVFLPLYVKVLVIVFLAVFALGSINTTRYLDNFQGTVLGEEEKKEEEKKKEEQKKEETKKQVEQKREEPKKQEETKKEESPIIYPTIIIKETKVLKEKIQQEGIKQETEIETTDGQKIKTKIEDDGTTKIEIEKGQLKLNYKLDQGKMILKVEDESNNEVKMDDEQILKLKEAVKKELEDEGITIATESSKPTFAKNGVTSVSEFPLSVDIATKQLIVTTPAGSKIVTVLPDKAVNNLLAAGVVTKVDSSQTTESELQSVEKQVKLTTYKNIMVYEIKGTKTHKVFGLLPINMPLKAYVSVEEGNPIVTEQSLLANVIDFLSP